MSVPETPYTRDEMYLSAIADGDSSGIPDRPYTRKEKYLDAIATGDSSGIPDTPYTREEMYLDAIAKNGGGGGGGGSTLINKSVSENGTYNASDDNADGYKKVTVNVQPDLQSKSVTITENGNSTVQPDSGKDGLSSVAVTVNVPNSYAAGDEGKVVSNGALVAQSAHAEVTANGTIDTTLNNSVVVNVPTGGGSSWTLIGSAEFTVNTTSTSSQTIGTVPLNIDGMAMGDFFVGHVRDKAGKRNGYFYGSNTFFLKYRAGAGSILNIGTDVIRYSDDQYETTSSTYGVYISSISSSYLTATVTARYRETDSRTIDGTYIVEIYKLSPPPGEAWLA